VIPDPPPVTRLLQTGLYVEDVARSRAFYDGGVIPGHDGHGTLLYAFAIAAIHLETWTARLRQVPNFAV
jgi:hypothetical protein